MSTCKECKHVMPTGLTCKSPALRASDFCFFHGQPVQPRSPIRQPRATEKPIDFPLILEREDILTAINQCTQGLAENAISTRRASILLMGVQMADAALTRTPVSFNFQQAPAGFGFPDEPPAK